MDSINVRGQIMDMFGGNKDENKVLDAMLSVITSKTMMHRIIKNQKVALLDETIDLIAFLQDYMNEN